VVTIIDVAQRAGVSRATASRVLRGQRTYISEDVRKRVLAVAEELGYHHNVIAASLRTRKTRSIGVITDDISSAFAPPLLAGIENYCYERGYSALVCGSGLDPVREKRYAEILVGRRVEGIIFVSPWVHISSWVHEETQQKVLTDIPVVYAYSSPSNQSQLSVVPDDFGGSVAATEHLVSLGHSRIGFIGGPEDWKATGDRFRGYVSVLESYGFPIETNWLGNAEWDDPTPGAEVAYRILKEAERPTAIVAANDVIAAGVDDAARELGLRVPEDVAVVGYDNRDMSRFVRPPLTTVQMPFTEIGTTATKLLLDWIEGIEVRVGTVVVPCKLLVRESCGQRLKAMRMDTGLGGIGQENG